VTHGDQFGSPTPSKLHAAFPQAELIVYGHTHRPLLELVDKTVTIMNPGSAGAPRFNLKPSVGIIELEAGFRPGEAGKAGVRRRRAICPAPDATPSSSQDSIHAWEWR